MDDNMLKCKIELQQGRIVIDAIDLYNWLLSVNEQAAAKKFKVKYREMEIELRR